jgi:hypothetical protein
VGFRQVNLFCRNASLASLYVELRARRPASDPQMLADGIETTNGLVTPHGVH